MMADELLNAQDLIAAKKHDTFHSEVITGKTGGLSTGANIDYATNAVTGQVQKTLPATVNGIDWTPVGNLTTDNCAFTKSTDYAVDDSGTQWAYNGTFPFTSTAPVVPSAPDYYVVHVNAAEAITNANGGSVQDFIDALLAENGSEKIGFGRGGSLPLSTIYSKLLKAYELSEFGKSSETVSNLQGVTGVTPSDKIQLVGYFSGSRIGGGEFIWRGDLPKTKHDGGLFIDPNKTFPVNWATGAAAWFSSVGAVGNGVWQRVYEGKCIRAEWFGAEPWAVGGLQDSTKSFQQCATIAGPGGQWKFSGKHRITSFVEIPARQTFGSESMSPPGFRSLTSTPETFNGVNTGTMDFDNSVFYDAPTGAAFRCGEAARPRYFVVYGRGLNTLGGNVYGYVPEASFYDVAAFEFGKFIKPTGVYIGYVRVAFDSKSIAPYSGNYYSGYRDCVLDVVHTAFKVSDAQSYNTKVYDCKMNVKRFGNFQVATKNFVVYGGSVEGYHDGTLIQGDSDVSFIGTYFETKVTSAMRGGAGLFMFRLIAPICEISFSNCLVYLNHTTALVRDLAGAGKTSVCLLGNKFRAGSSQDIDARVIDCSANPAYGSVAGDTLTNSGSYTLSYVPGVAAKSLMSYHAPLLDNAIE